MRAVVLSGGGAKGSYQIGVWKALRHLRIKYGIVTGTSVGALNGALMVQKDYFKALLLWKRISMKTLFGEDASFNNNREILKMFRNQFFKHGGIEVIRIENLINKYININKFFHSKIKYGLVTVSVSKRKALYLTKDKIKKEKLADYLMASASCYPAFQIKEIDEARYIDGGFVDNMLINMAIDLGADEVIAVDLNAPGMIRMPTKKKVPLTIIKPNNELSFFLNFDKKLAKRNMLFGYNDTMKKFGKLEGHKYTFKRGSIARCHQKYDKICSKYLKDVLKSKKLMNEIINLPLLKKAKKKKYSLTIMEELGKMFDLDETKIYSYQKFNRQLKKNVSHYIKNKNKKTKRRSKIENSKIIVIDIYNKLRKGNIKAIQKSLLLNPDEFLKALYLYGIYEK